MNIKVELSFASQAELVAFFAGPAVSAPEKAAVSAIAAPKSAPAPAPSPAVTAAAPAAPSAPATESPSDPKPVAPATPAASSASSAKPAESADSGAIEYATVAAAITNAVKTDRARAVAVLAQFGCKKGTELKAEQFADFLKALG